MKTFKKLLCILVVFMFAILFVGCTNNEKNEGLIKSGKIYVGVSTDYAPFEFVDLTKKGSERYVGSDIDLAKEIAKENGLELVIKTMTFETLLAAIDSNKIDMAISGITYDDKRAENYLFSHTYFSEGDGNQILVFNKNRKDEFPTLESFNKKDIKVAAQNGSLQQSLVEEQLPDCKLIKFEDINNAFDALKNGKYDAIALASSVADSLLTASVNSNLMASTFSFEVKDSAYYVLMRKGNVTLAEKVNPVCDKAAAGLYKKWVEDAKKLYEDLGENAGELVPDNKRATIFSVFIDYAPDFFRGLGVTLAFSVISVFLALFLGAVLCLGRMSTIKPISFVCTSYVEIIRGVPLLLQLLLIYALMPRIDYSKFINSEVIAVILALFLNSGAYVAEIFRSGIQAVDKGQMEAGRALGLSKWTTMRKVIFPQAVRNVLPSIGNELIDMIKETSLASTVDAGIGELMSIKKQITAASFINIPPFIIIGAMYFIVTFSLSKVVRYIERRLDARD